MDVSEALSPFEDHFYVGRWNIHLLSLLCAAAGLARLSMAWLEAIQFTDYRNEEGATVTIRDYRESEVWWQLCRQNTSMQAYTRQSQESSYSSAIQDHIGPREYECLCIVFGSWMVLWPHAAEVETHRAGAVFYVATDNEIEEEEAMSYILGNALQTLVSW